MILVDDPHYEKNDDIIIYLSDAKASIILQSLWEEDEDFISKKCGICKNG